MQRPLNWSNFRDTRMDRWSRLFILHTYHQYQSITSSYHTHSLLDPFSPPSIHLPMTLHYHDYLLLILRQYQPQWLYTERTTSLLPFQNIGVGWVVSLYEWMWERLRMETTFGTETVVGKCVILLKNGLKLLRDDVLLLVRHPDVVGLVRWCSQWQIMSESF